MVRNLDNQNQENPGIVEGVCSGCQPSSGKGCETQKETKSRLGAAVTVLQSARGGIGWGESHADRN